MVSDHSHFLDPSLLFIDWNEDSSKLGRRVDKSAFDNNVNKFLPNISTY